MKILLLDNFDSFTFNLYHYLEKTGDHQIDVIRNNALVLEDVKKYDKIVLSPGPGLPEEAGILMDLITKYHSSKSILGVCLGHQAIAECFGGKLKNLSRVVHGQATPIRVTCRRDITFKSLPQEIKVGRYHSWVVDKEFVPRDFVVSSVDENGEIMSFYHQYFDLRGIQFHPESILTEHGQQMIANWVNQNFFSNEML